MWPYYMAQAGLEFLILLALQPFTHRDYRCAMPMGSFRGGRMYFPGHHRAYYSPSAMDSAGIQLTSGGSQQELWRGGYVQLNKLNTLLEVTALKTTDKNLGVVF